MHQHVDRLIGRADVEIIAVDARDRAGTARHRRKGLTSRRQGVVREDRIDPRIGVSARDREDANDDRAIGGREFVIPIFYAGCDLRRRDRGGNDAREWGLRD